MIDISYLANDINNPNSLESILNAEIVEQIMTGNTVLDNGRVTYRFLIYTDGGEYKDYDYIDGNGDISAEPTNKIVRYINCEFDTTGSQINGVASVEMSFSARLEILIPLVNAGRGKKKKLELVNTIRQVIDNAFRLNSMGTYEDGDVPYQYGVSYQLADTGAREKRAEIGDSIIMNAYLSYFMVQNGVNSADFEVYIDAESTSDQTKRVYFTRLGFNRGSTNESNVPSDSENGAGKNTPTSTVFGINFDMPLRTNYADQAIMNYLLNGEKIVHKIDIINSFGEPSTYYMIFNEVSVNAETTKFSSVTVSMVEALYEVQNNG